MELVIKHFEKYGKDLSDNEFQKLVEKYNNDNRKPRNKEGNQLTFFPIMVGSRIVFGSTFQDYKNEIEKQLQSDFVDLDNVKKEYQTKVIDKYKNALNTREIYQTFKQGNEPKLCITKTSIKDKYLFYTNVQDVKEVLKLEKYLKGLNQSNVKDIPFQEKNEVFTFANNFNQANTEDVYNYFYDLVKKDYLSKSDYEKYLKLAFEDQEKPSQKFSLKGDYYKKDIFKLFGNFYKMNGKEHGQKQMYSELLSNYFNGFDNAYSELTRDL